MKRCVVAVAFLVLVCAVALPAAYAGVLYQDDFSTDALLKAKETYVQGRGSAITADDTILPFYIRDGALWSSPPDSTTGSDGNTAPDADPPAVRYLLLTGDPKWANVAIQCKTRVDSQGTGSFSLVLRAAPKAKVSDPDTWYEFRYQTGSPVTPADEEASGITPAEGTPPVLRIMKVVNGRWKVLAETDADKATTPIAHVANGGDQQESGALFRFVAKGNLLQAFIALPGKEFVKFLEVVDDELKAGRVGLAELEYNPVFDDLLVEDAP